jgi:tRNA dimethylallyltransferase
MNKTCIIIAGPTAVGKTALAIELAKYFSTEIISADSRQCYKELNIGVARPSPEELDTVPHHFIASHSIQQDISASDYENYALNCADEIFKKTDVAIMVGGTGLYIRAFCEGLDQIPAIEETIRNDIKKQYQDNGIEWLQQQLKEIDPLYAEKGEMQNPQRMMRALEVKAGTGQSIISFQSQQKKQRPFNIIKIGMELPRPVLYDRINRRVDIMMQDGLLEEAKTVLPFRDRNALQTVGYRELFDHLEGFISLEKAVELIKQNSRHYAKRQLTWFKKDAGIKWIDAADDNIEKIAGLL